MFPWEHVLFAYVFFSLFVHLRYRSRPADWPVVALVAGSLLPDLVDKPLAWEFSVFATGWGIAHSIFVAGAISILVYAIARRRGVDRVGLGFAFGYLLHLVGDVVPASLGRGRFYPDPILWPFGNPTSRYDQESYAGGVHFLLTKYANEVLAMDLTPLLSLQLGSIVLGVALWIVDGRPGLGLVTSLVRDVITPGRHSG